MPEATSATLTVSPHGTNLNEGRRSAATTIEATDDQSVWPEYSNICSGTEKPVSFVSTVAAPNNFSD